MSGQMTVREYFRQPETMRPMELVYGVVREPPAPNYGHQTIVTRLTVLLDEHVRAHGLGQVCVSPVDVVLDEERALVVQPDVVFIAKDCPESPAQHLESIEGHVVQGRDDEIGVRKLIGRIGVRDDDRLQAGRMRRLQAPAGVFDGHVVPLRA